VIRFHGISRLEGGKLDGIHLLWSPHFPTGHSLDGYTIFRRRARGEKARHCFELTQALLSQARSAGFVALPDALVWAVARAPSDPLWTYRAELTARHSMVTITAPTAKAAFIGTSDGAVIAGAAFTGSSVTLLGSDIAIVWIVGDNAKLQVRICGDVSSAREWAQERPIVKNLQVPFPSVNPAVSSAAAGRALAASRADPEPFAGNFDEVTRYADAALSRPGGVAAMRVMSEKPGDGGNAWDVSPYGLAIAPTLLAPWRRGWAMSHLDRDGLVDGDAYDYRIVGTVPRRDRDEALFDLHTVPRGYRLPRHFRWGTAQVWTDLPPVVQSIEGTGGDPATFRKGFKTRRMTLLLDVPTPRIIIETLPGASVHAKGFRYGAAVGSVNAASGPRTLLDFGAEVDTILVEAHLSIAGIVPLPIDPALDPDEPVEISQTIYDVRYVPTSPPDAPAIIAVTNLSDPARTAARGVHETNRGFAIQWDAPSAIDPAALPYLPPSTAAPPTEVAYYVLEHTWHGAPFTPVHGDGLQVSGRNAATATDAPGWGFDVLKAFPPANAVPSSHTEFVTAIEVFEPGAIRYGDEVTYRVQSVDATGRRSAPRTSAPVPLRKHVRPPPPTTPATAPAAPDDVPVSGVRVALYQHDDPDLTTVQRAIADDTDMVVLRWGWGPDQRALDPDVVEFRVYWYGAPLTAIDVRPTGAPVATGFGWNLPVTVNRPVAVDEFAEVVIVLGVAYRIIGHGAGIAVTLALAPSVVDPALAPSPVPFTVNRTTSAELNPEYWDERVCVVPRVPAGGSTVETYEQILPADWIATSDTASRQRVAYGVSAADAEPYIPDRRTALESSPRAGNESTVAAAEVTARYFGRPSLAIADLADVPAITLARRAGVDVHGTLRPADFAPAGATLAPRMLLERLPASAVLRRLRVEPGAISLTAHDGTTHPWPLSAADQAAIREGYAAGLVPDRFAAHAATMLDGLDDAAERRGIIDPAAPFEDTIPNRPARWLYRLRAVDAMQRPSEQAQMLGVVLHVPSPARAVAPALMGVEVASGNAIVTVDLAHVVGMAYVFLGTDASLGMATASLATIRNRDDLAPIDRFVVRDADGRVLPALATMPGAGSLATASAPVPAGGPVLHVWALSVTPDGVPSRLVGPLHASALEA
jgi:hypothetical protein